MLELFVSAAVADKAVEMVLTYILSLWLWCLLLATTLSPELNSAVINSSCEVLIKLGVEQRGGVGDAVKNR